jgi:hypothetical protein
MTTSYCIDGSNLFIEGISSYGLAGSQNLPAQQRRDMLFFALFPFSLFPFAQHHE